MNLAELAPDYVREAKIVLALARPLDRRLPYRVVEITASLASDAVASGLVLPIDFTVTTPSKKFRTVHTFRRVVPTSIFFTPLEGGPHLVRLTEQGHNRWYGALVVDVEGDPLEE